MRRILCTFLALLLFIAMLFVAGCKSADDASSNAENPVTEGYEMNSVSPTDDTIGGGDGGMDTGAGNMVGNAGGG